MPGSAFGSATSPRSAMRTYRKDTHVRSVGGTPNPVQYIYGSSDRATHDYTNRTWCVVATHPVPTYVPPTTGYGYDTSMVSGNSGARRSDSAVHCSPAVVVDIATLNKRAMARGMTLKDYCELIGAI